MIEQCSVLQKHEIKVCLLFCSPCYSIDVPDLPRMLEHNTENLAWSGPDECFLLPWMASTTYATKIVWLCSTIVITMEGVSSCVRHLTARDSHEGCSNPRERCKPTSARTVQIMCMQFSMHRNRVLDQCPLAAFMGSFRKACQHKVLGFGSK